MNTNLFIASLLASSTVEGTHNFTATRARGKRQGGNSSDSELVETNQYIGPSLTRSAAPLLSSAQQSNRDPQNAHAFAP